MYILYVVLSVIITFQLVLPFLTVLASRIFGKERLRQAKVHNNQQWDYACIITAYKNSDIAQPLVHSLLRQSWPHFHIYLVADECATLPDLPADTGKLTVLAPDPPLRLKAKSIIFAMERMVRPHDFVVIFDADNLAHPDFLQNLNPYADAGFQCIQGRRTAKNADSSIAAADSLGEIYKNYFERFAPWMLGSSSVISGSGMATQTDLYQQYLESPAIAQGQHKGKKMLQEDKILQNFLMKRNHTIAYAKNAICYDEKVESAQAVETQRSRWLFSYFQNLPNTLHILFSGLTGLNWNQFFFRLITLSLPMFIQVALGAVLFLLGLWLQPWWTVVISVGIIIFSLNVFWTMHLSGAAQVARRALTAIPAFIFRQFRALFRMVNPQKNFAHTEHSRKIDLDQAATGPEGKKPGQ